MDESTEMRNRTIKPSLTKVAQAYTCKLAPILESQKNTCENAGQNSFETVQVRDTSGTLVYYRMEPMQKVLPFLRAKWLFMGDGRDSVV